MNPVSLLPASAAAFAPRAAPTVVLDSKINPWLTQTLKRNLKFKRSLNTVSQQSRCLKKVLSRPDAIWTLCSLMMPKGPNYELLHDTANPILEGLANYQLLHVNAYVVHVDMVSQHEIAFKLNQDTISALTTYHKHVYCANILSRNVEWANKMIYMQNLHADFVHAVNKYVFRTNVRALEGLEEDGSGELLDSRSEEVKFGILGLFHVNAVSPQSNILHERTSSGSGNDTLDPSAELLVPLAFSAESSTPVEMLTRTNVAEYQDMITSLDKPTLGLLSHDYSMTPDQLNRFSKMISTEANVFEHNTWPTATWCNTLGNGEALDGIATTLATTSEVPHENRSTMQSMNETETAQSVAITHTDNNHEWSLYRLTQDHVNVENAVGTGTFGIRSQSPEPLLSMELTFPEEIDPLSAVHNSSEPGYHSNDNAGISSDIFAGIEYGEGNVYCTSSVELSSHYPLTI